MGRMLKIKALKYNPQRPVEKPRFVTYEVEEHDHSFTLFLALTYIRENLDADLSFDFVCRAGICGSCGMMINGKPGLACRTLTNTLPKTITLLPMPSFELIKDLSVNTGKWMDGMSKRVESWVHTNEVTDISKIEKAIDPDEADAVFELDRCIECGCCVAGCGTKLLNENFIAPAGLNRIARFEADSHDQRTHDDYYELIGDENGIFGCMSLVACDDVCPKHLPLQSKIAYLRRKMVSC